MEKCGTVFLPLTVPDADRFS